MAAKKRITVKFHEDIYPEAAVRAAAGEYAAFASFSISREGKYTKAVIRASGAGTPDALAEEFSNCVLFNSR